MSKKLERKSAAILPSPFNTLFIYFTTAATTSCLVGVEIRDVAVDFFCLEIEPVLELLRDHSLDHIIILIRPVDIHLRGFTCNKVGGLCCLLREIN